jgi:hypothetical protein
VEFPESAENPQVRKIAKGKGAHGPLATPESDSDAEIVGDGSAPLNITMHVRNFSKPIDSNGNVCTTRERAQKGIPNPRLMTMRCLDRNGKVKEFQFSGSSRAPTEFDWSNKNHILRLNAWRDYYYSHGGIDRPRLSTTWHRDESLWVELYFRLLFARVLQRKEVIYAGEDLIFKQHRAFFRGKVLQTDDGLDLPPLRKRGKDSFLRQYRQTSRDLHDRLIRLLQFVEKADETGLPMITTEMLDTYKQNRQVLVDKLAAIEPKAPDADLLYLIKETSGFISERSEDAGKFTLLEESHGAESVEAWCDFIRDLPVEPPPPTMPGRMADEFEVHSQSGPDVDPDEKETS